jgi:hypothetical protein
VGSFGKLQLSKREPEHDAHQGQPNPAGKSHLAGQHHRWGPFAEEPFVESNDASGEQNPPEPPSDHGRRTDQVTLTHAAFLSSSAVTSSATKSETSQSFVVTPAAIAGVTRSVR